MVSLRAHGYREGESGEPRARRLACLPQLRVCYGDPMNAATPTARGAASSAAEIRESDRAIPRQMRSSMRMFRMPLIGVAQARPSRREKV